MKTRKRNRSQDCEECLPIAKRITRLNIQSAGGQNGDDGDIQSPGIQCGCRNGQVGPMPGPSWSQYGPSGSGLQCSGINSSCVCGSQLCHTSNVGCMCNSHQGNEMDTEAVKQTAIQTYASHHELSTNDLMGYKPDLDKGQNPHYFQINSVLYQAHLEKAYRQGLHMKK